MKILLMLSGGVDSAVAAWLLQKQGADFEAAYMKNWINEDEIIGECPWQEDLRDARAVAEHLGVELRVVNQIEEYKSRVADYLLEAYQNGLTPNPDVMCNSKIKFGAFLAYAHKSGFTHVASGHYAGVKPLPDGTYTLARGSDTDKDQSYFLAYLRSEQLAASVFPLANFTKTQVRRMALDAELPNARKKDSQGICFIGKVKMRDFLRTYIEDKPGKIIDTSGAELGKHSGLHFFTQGQKRGIGVASNVHGKAYVVVERNFAKNELVIALDDESSKMLFASKARIRNISLINPNTRLEDLGEQKIRAQVRYRAPSCEAKLANTSGNGADIYFSEKQRAIAPGQICALYTADDRTCLGAGIFEKVYH